MASIFSDFLTALGVPHTVGYADAQFDAMPFKTLFGLANLMKGWNIPTRALRLTDKTEARRLPVPFIAQTPEGLIIVTGQTPDAVQYLSQGQPQTMSRREFTDVWTGVVMLAFPRADSAEPGYEGHRLIEMANASKKWILYIGLAALFAYFFVANRLYADVWTILLTLFNLGGLWLSWQLVRKTLHIGTRAGDAVCGVLQEGGCDSILELKASSFFGIFKWSEVGLTYFSVSLVALLVAPQSWPWLALCNVVCLPFTVWSIWYQKFRAKKWCTLCVSVQSTLWLLFIAYLCGGFLAEVHPIRWGMAVLIVAYAVVLMASNRVISFVSSLQHTPDDETH